MQKQYDIIVIGSGPGGEGAAMQASKQGYRVAVIERYDQVGGGCTHWGTIPSKSLRHAIQLWTESRQNPLLNKNTGPRLELPQLLSTAGSVIRSQVDMRQAFYDRNRVQVVEGHATFMDPHRIELTQADGSIFDMKADYFVIASGSHPYHPPDVDFNHPRIFDADTILQLDFTPQHLIVYGAGVIGCEYASMFRNLGIKVDLINTRDRLLSFLDDEIVDALAYHLRDQGVMVRHNEVCDRVESLGDQAVNIRLKSGKQMRCDALLWANGRSGNTEALGLESLGIQANNRGNIPVDARHRTSQAHIYAVGDVSGPPGLASAAYNQGRFATLQIHDPQANASLVENIPNGIYTSPEISSIGRTERELTDAKVPFEVGHSLFKNLARAQITGHPIGMLKILFHRDSHEILGVHCFGHQAAEIVHIGQAVMTLGTEAGTLDYFVNTTFNYPTMAEAYRVAALNGLNRLS